MRMQAARTGLAACALVALSMAWATPGSAAIDPLVTDTDPPDTEEQFFGGSSNQGWTGGDVNPADNLDNNSEATEGNYLSALLGFVESDPDRPQLITRIDSGGAPIGQTSVTDFDPGFDWTYAVVKVGTGQGEGHNFFRDDGDGLLTTGTFNTGISHITFFTPLPAAAWLLLTGLAGFFGLRWRERRKAALAAA